jgi:Spy/CpxP family protein refolding chaperone
MRAIRSWAGAAALMLVLVPASAALAQPGQSDQVRAPGEAGRGQGGPGSHERMDRQRGPFAGLDLTDAQKAKLKEMRTRGEAGGAGLHKQMKRLRNQMEAAMLEDRLDRRKILQLAEQIGGVQTKLSVHRSEQHLNMLDVLTAEQREQWLSRPQRGQGGRGMGRMGHHSPRGPRGGRGSS